VSGTLVILCLAAFAVVATLTSAALAVALPWIDCVFSRLRGAKQVRAWLGVAVLPAVLGTTVLVSALLPSMGLGVDHCLAHEPHHPHLCAQHALVFPGSVLIVIAALVALQSALAVASFARAAFLGWMTCRTLTQGSEHMDDVLAFRSAEPHAFVLGIVAPTVHASTGLLALAPALRAPVLAHERAHAEARDPLWRAIFPLLALGHLPMVSGAIARRLITAQEMAADTKAAKTVGSRLHVADALVTLARLHSQPCPGLSFTHGDVGARVRALLQEPAVPSRWIGRSLLGVSGAIVCAISLFPEPVHHAVETVLGILS